ncbi:MAG TPA: formyltetrahydrofolate deformylase [Oscillatoriaceae cyanobacterium M33_DOE_052]|uniref:Formyltetrahydrofolate deformylase n=1 Tax=Planktothricoides sp. SpSt-374 TaxID=2282167 RepID=A0A7C3VRY4_9CYAN|nr:formyltetrahydrofolate deformylase [Oscillatoriaceae cyanobacterium M33_DOE_052]
MTIPTATLLVSCPDNKGLVAKIANFISSHNGNIIHADHHTDFAAGLFLTRIEWQLEGFDIPHSDIAAAFAPLAAAIKANWELKFSDTIPRLSIWVSRQNHCLLDLLWRQQAKEFSAAIPLIISNHPDLQDIATQFGADFYHIPITKENKAEQEAKQLELLNQYNIDLVVLAKYMQVLSPEFISKFPKVINIHHSFLPAFAGAKPYHQAYKRGVKIIGATSHYVTAELDAGPIIEQDVARVSHRDEVADLIRKGKDLERVVLARAVRLHLQNRVLVYGDSFADMTVRTAVFA